MAKDFVAAPFEVTPLMVGTVRLSANLAPEEAKHGAVVRDFDPYAARQLAIKLLQAADEAERLWQGLNA